MVVSEISVNLLGPFEARLDGEPLTRFPYAKVRGLLAYLALESQRPQSRATLAALLWPDQPERTARASLSQALTSLRALLGDKPDAPPALLTEADAVQLNPHWTVTVDVAQFLALLRVCDAHAHHSWRTCSPCAERQRQAAALYRGNFLAELSIADSSAFEEWAGLQREPLQQRALSALGRLADWAEWRGQYAHAIEAVRRQVALDPYQERGQRQLIRLLALNGELAAAQAQYRSLEALLAREIDARPEEATAHLHAQIRQGNLAGLRREPPFAVPGAPSPLVGRAADLEMVCALLQDGVRGLTLTGTAGVGKTRLALEAAQRLRFEFEEGVTFVALAPLQEAGRVGEAIANALEIQEKPGRSALETLRTHLRNRHLLLVLDNFEHVAAAAPLVAQLLEACPGLKVLATSRQRLNLRGERQLPLQPLVEAEAMQLFQDRLRAAGGSLAGDSDRAHYREICRRLDGLPLAIELFAARARRLSPAEMLRQLEQPLQALTSGPRDAPERHQALRSALQWSFDLLDAEEQQVFTCLGVFVGGFTAEAAQVVVGVSPAVAPRLEALCEANLALAQAGAGETRYSFLETLREFALERLAAQGGAPAAYQRHADYFLALAKRAEPELIGPDQKAWFDRLGRELPNLRAALAWCQANSVEMALRLAAALGQFWEVRGHMAEGLAWLQAALSVSPRAWPEARAWALLAAGRITQTQSDLNASRALLKESRQLFLRLEEPAGLAHALYKLGMVTARQGDIPASLEQLRESLDIARAAGDTYSQSGALTGLALVADRQGDPAQAISYCEQALALNQARRDPRNTAGGLLNLGIQQYSLGNFAAARQRIEASLAVAHQLDDYQLIRLCQLNLGNVLIAQGHPAAARDLLEEAIALHIAHRDELSADAALATLGRALEKLDDLAAARERQGQALRLRAEAGDRRGAAVSLSSLARLDNREGQPARAATILGASEAIHQAIGSVVSPNARVELEKLVASVKTALGEAAFEQAWAAGRALSFEAAVAFALAKTAAGLPS